jgi:hypothetical protein
MDSLIADGWIQEKPFRHWGVCDHRQARHRSRTARKEAETTVRLKKCAADDPCRERGAIRADSDADFFFQREEKLFKSFMETWNNGNTISRNVAVMNTRDGAIAEHRGK